MRLWGADGQRALSESRICLLNASPVGTETMKNLVLPGCGTICVVDAETVSERDTCNNFFVRRSDIGAPRAKVALDLLLEMNDEDVKGQFIVEKPLDLLARNPTFLSQFTLVVATQMRDAELVRIAAACRECRIPLVAVRTYGLIGYLRTITEEHTIVESKPDNSREDLRVARPFPALRAFADAIHLDTLNDMVHGHVPYVVLLIKALEVWRREEAAAAAASAAAASSQTSGAAAAAPPPSAGDAAAAHLRCPRTLREKEAFRSVLTGMARSRDETNFEEAATKAFEAFAGALDMDPDSAELLSDPAALSLSPKSSPFWIVVRALGDFAAAEGRLPLSGALPDMTATTDLYVGLQRIYQAQAAEDASGVASRVAALCAAAGVPLDTAAAASSAVPSMARHARYVRVLRLRSLEEEFAAPVAAASTVDSSASPHPSEDVISELETAAEAGEAGEAASPVVWYIMLRAADKFFATYGRFPGQVADSVSRRGGRGLCGPFSCFINVRVRVCESGVVYLIRFHSWRCDFACVLLLIMMQTDLESDVEKVASTVKTLTETGMGLPSDLTQRVLTLNQCKEL